MPYVAARGKGNDTHTALKIQGSNWISAEIGFQGKQDLGSPSSCALPGLEAKCLQGGDMSL